MSTDSLYICPKGNSKLQDIVKDHKQIQGERKKTVLFKKKTLIWIWTARVTHKAAVKQINTNQLLWFKHRVIVTINTSQNQIVLCLSTKVHKQQPRYKFHFVTYINKGSRPKWHLLSHAHDVWVSAHTCVWTQYYGDWKSSRHSPYAHITVVKPHFCCLFGHVNARGRCYLKHTYQNYSS